MIAVLISAAAILALLDAWLFGRSVLECQKAGGLAARLSQVGIAVGTLGLTLSAVVALVMGIAFEIQHASISQRMRQDEIVAGAVAVAIPLLGLLLALALWKWAGNW